MEMCTRACMYAHANTHTHNTHTHTHTHTLSLTVEGYVFFSRRNVVRYCTHNTFVLGRNWQRNASTHA